MLLIFVFALCLTLAGCGNKQCNLTVIIDPVDAGAVDQVILPLAKLFTSGDTVRLTAVRGTLASRNSWLMGASWLSGARMATATDRSVPRTA